MTPTLWSVPDVPFCGPDARSYRNRPDTLQLHQLRFDVSRPLTACDVYRDKGRLSEFEKLVPKLEHPLQLIPRLGR
jgi:hypothetical protein